MSHGAVALRYARAVLDVAMETGDPGPLRGDLQDAVSVLEAQPELQRLLGHPALAAERKRAVLSAVWRRSPADLLLRLLALLAERQRLGLLPQVAKSYADQWNRRRGVVTAEVATADALPPAQEKGLVAALARLSGREVEVRGEVRPELLGGVLVRMEGKVFDGSVRGRLRALRTTLGARA